MKYYLIGNLLIVSLLMACSTVKEPDLGNFDAARFRSDRGGCNNQRTEQQSELRQLEPKLLGLAENQVIKAFGRYDYQILDRRNQKIFVYFLEKGPHCQQIQQASSAQEMVLYFNAIGLVKEVSFRTGIPAEQ